MAIQAQEPDIQTLQKLGYAQELRRRMGGFSNFAVSFTKTQGSLSLAHPSTSF